MWEWNWSWFPSKLSKDLAIKLLMQRKGICSILYNSITLGKVWDTKISKLVHCYIFNQCRLNWIVTSAISIFTVTDIFSNWQKTTKYFSFPSSVRLSNYTRSHFQLKFSLASLRTNLINMKCRLKFILTDDWRS